MRVSIDESSVFMLTGKGRVHGRNELGHRQKRKVQGGVEVGSKRHLLVGVTLGVFNPDPARDELYRKRLCRRGRRTRRCRVQAQ